MAWMITQMKNLEKEQRFIEWAELYGTFEERVKDMLESFLQAPFFSDNDTVMKF
jgi:hypothetical protein